MTADLTPEEVQQLVDAINSGNAMPYVDKMLRLLAETWECEKPDIGASLGGMQERLACSACASCRKLAIVEGMK